MIKLFQLRDKNGNYAAATGIVKFPQDARVFNTEDEAEDWKDENYTQFKNFQLVEQCFSLADCANFKYYKPE